MVASTGFRHGSALDNACAIKESLIRMPVFVSVDGGEASEGILGVLDAGDALVLAEIDGKNDGRNRPVDDGSHGKLQVGVWGLLAW
jgi:hypothetical protein